MIIFIELKDFAIDDLHQRLYPANRSANHLRYWYNQELRNNIKEKKLIWVNQKFLVAFDGFDYLTKKRENSPRKMGFLPTIEENLCTTRTTLGCKSENRNKVCQINASSLKSHSQVQEPGTSFTKQLDLRFA